MQDQLQRVKAAFTRFAADKRVRFACATLALAAATFYTTRWALAPDINFSWTYIDVTGVNYSCFRMSYADFVQVLPNPEAHDDRPVGWMLNKLIWETFQFDCRAQMATFIAIHFVNVMLVFLLMRKILPSAGFAFAGALLYALHRPSLEAVTYTGAMFEIACLPFVVASIWLFMRGTKVSLVLSALCYFAALRSKEIALVLPGVLFLYELAMRGEKPTPSVLLSVMRKCSCHIAVLALCFICLIPRILAAANHTGLYAAHGAENPYAMVFTFKEFYTGVGLYLKTLNYGLNEKISIAIFCAILLTALVRKNFKVAYTGVAIIVSLLPVIFFANHRFTFYLYVPAVFYAIYVMFVADWLLKQLPATVHGKAQWGIVGIILVLSVVRFHHGGLEDRYAWVKSQSQPTNLLFGRLAQELPRATPGTHFYISDAPTPEIALNPTYHHVRDLLRLYYKDMTMEAIGMAPREKLRQEYDQDTAPKAFLQFVDGKCLMVAAADGATQVAAKPDRGEAAAGLRK